MPDVADRVREHLLAFPTHFDPVFGGEPSPERLFGQLVSMYNRQSFISLHICLELGHVVPAGQLARALLEESIRWEWITDEPQTRAATHVGELRRNLKNISEECDALGVDGTSFLDPSPFWTTTPLRPFEGGNGGPGHRSLSLETRLSNVSAPSISRSSPLTSRPAPLHLACGNGERNGCCHRRLQLYGELHC